LNSASIRTFTQRELWLAVLLAAGIECGFFAVLIMAGANRGKVHEVESPAPSEVPIKVNPVLDDVPLLKLGGKRMRPKLPELWKKNPPIQRYEAASAPSPMASMTPEAIPSSPLVRKDAGPPPPPDAAVVKQVDQVLVDAGPPAKQTPQVEGEGSPDGIKGGTETDPLKARAVGQYTQLIIAWFNARFRQPDIECETLKTLRSVVAPTLGPDRTITAFSVVRPSGNATFDERIKSTMSSIVGQQIPPPPPLYPDIANIPPVTFKGQCK
jgi:hypothetical protein